MRKNLTVFLTVVMMMITGASLSYAAFPIANQEVTATTNTPASSTAAPAAEYSSMDAATNVTKTTRGGGKSQVVALVLVLLVGGLGIHRFYLGYTWQGIVQLLTLGGCGIWALIDLIRIATGSLQPKDGSYDKTL